MAMMEQEQARVGEHANSFDRIRASDIADSRMHLRGPDAARPIAHQPQQGGLFTYVSCEARVPEGHPLRTIRAIADVAAGVVIGWHLRDLTKLEAKLSEDVRRFKKAKPFWRPMIFAASTSTP